MVKPPTAVPPVNVTKLPLEPPAPVTVTIGEPLTVAKGVVRVTTV